MEAALPFTALERQEDFASAVEIAEPLRILRILELREEVVVQLQEPLQTLFVASQLVALQHGDGGLDMDPPKFLVPFQLLLRITLAVHEVEDSSIGFVPAVIDDAEGNVHGLADQLLVMQPQPQILKEPQGFEIMSRIDLPALVAVDHGIIHGGDVLHHGSDRRLIEDIEYFV